jgi:hypothetical protein
VDLQRTFGKSWEEVKKAVSCFLCGSVARNPVTTVCCGEIFCRDCILAHLDRTVVALDEDAMECPNCDRKELSMADLVEDRAIKTVVGQSTTGGAFGGTTGLVSASSQPKRQRVSKTTGGASINVELAEDVISAPTTESPTKTRVARHPNTILVPGGHNNPFFKVGAPMLTPEEFEAWKSAFRAALINTGQLVLS